MTAYHWYASCSTCDWEHEGDGTDSRANGHMRSTKGHSCSTSWHTTDLCESLHPVSNREIQAVRVIAKGMLRSLVDSSAARDRFDEQGLDCDMIDLVYIEMRSLVPKVSEQDYATAYAVLTEDG